MIRFDIEARPDLEPPYVLVPVEKGIVCLAEAALTEMADRSPQAVADARLQGQEDGVAECILWLRKHGCNLLAKRLLEEFNMGLAG